MHARLTNLVIHGNEPNGAAPFMRVAQVDMNARLFSGGHLIGITFLGIERPEVNVMVFPDGNTNLPAPAHSGVRAWRRTHLFRREAWAQETVS